MTWEIHEEPREERLNATLHGLGALLAVAGLSTMLVRAAVHGDAWHVVSAAVFGSSLLLLYMASSLYHGISHSRAKNILEILDHCAIYLLIAGTYTPFALVTLRGPLGWSLFGIVWGLALFGIVMQAVYPGRLRNLMTFLYVLMGWLVILAAKPLLANLPGAALAWLVAGGVLYTGGVYFYYRKRFVFSHAVWHLFVLAGSVCHFVAVYGFVLKAAT